MNGIHEVTGSIPVWSTIFRKATLAIGPTRQSISSTDRSSVATDHVFPPTDHFVGQTDYVIGLSHRSNAPSRHIDRPHDPLL
jgi:hypothetical protein